MDGPGFPHTFNNCAKTLKCTENVGPGKVDPGDAFEIDVFPHMDDDDEHGSLGTGGGLIFHSKVKG